MREDYSSLNIFFMNRVDIMNEPILGKAELHDFDYTPISWYDFLKLRNAAKTAANNIGYPVYLVGSSLSKSLPRDIDISVIIPLKDYEKIFGKIPEKLDDIYVYMANIQNKCFEKIEDLHFCLIDTHHLDIKICPDTWWQDKDKMLLASPDINR